jgi:hypothetical protein
MIMKNKKDIECYILKTRTMSGGHSNWSGGPDCGPRAACCTLLSYTYSGIASSVMDPSTKENIKKTNFKE